jgi:hypothetical protein
MHTHDYTKRTWGHDYIFRPVDGGMKASLSGWGTGIEAGDYLLLEQPDGGGSTRYKVDEIRYERDPRDQWHAKASFAPRATAK